MNYVGIDIGSTASKVAVIGEKELEFVLPTGWSSKETTQTIREKLLEDGIDVLSEETKVVATGYGRVAVEFADHVITEITCHARGGREMAGDDCGIIDVGGQDTKVILVEHGMVQDFLMNDKCSAGTGRFLEIMANTLCVDPGRLCELARSGSGISISSMCTVFAESEVISLIGSGASKEDIAFGIVESIVNKVASQCGKLTVPGGPCYLTGGLCESPYILESLSQKLGVEVRSSPLARYAGAIGAALAASKISSV